MSDTEAIRTHMLEQIRNWRACGAGIPAGYELAAVVDYVTSMWGDFACVEATAEQGVADEDQEGIRALIEAHELDVDPEEAVRALHHDCIRDVLKSMAKRDRDLVVHGYRSPNFAAELLELPDGSFAAYRTQWLDEHPCDTSDELDRMISCPIIPADEAVEKALADWAVAGKEALETIDLPLYLLITASTGPGWRPWSQGGR